MLLFHFQIYFLFACTFLKHTINGDNSKEVVSHYLNVWMVYVEVAGNHERAKIIFEEEGFRILEQVAEMPALYYLCHENQLEKEHFANDVLSRKLAKYKEVIWIQQDYVVSSVTNIDTLQAVNGNCRRKSDFGVVPTDTRNNESFFNDPLYPEQWFLQPTNNDIGVYDVWTKFNLFGSGVIVVIVDDGLFIDHMDLKLNYNKEYALDLYKEGSDPIPTSKTYSHGTKCAGIIAMNMNNTICGIGIAPAVTLGVVRLYRNSSYTLSDQAKAYMFKAKEIDIILNAYNFDDGKSFPSIPPPSREAIHYGATEGRRGKGIIYVFSAGNGKWNDDMCGCDPFVNDIHTIAVAGVNSTGCAIEYSERCAAIMVTVYSGDGEVTPSNIVTVSMKSSDSCSDDFYGTSACAPIVAGAIALVLEANPNLSWRDVQHILAWTSEYTPLAKECNTDWKRNNAGFFVSHDFGFGLLNVYKMVLLAQNFKSVSPLSRCVVRYKIKKQSYPFNRKQARIISMVVNSCSQGPTEINYIEHVQLYVDVKYTCRGDLQIDLVSPQGTVSHLLESRMYDTSRNGIRNYTFDSVHMWGENPKGKWDVIFFDKTGSLDNHGYVKKLTLIIYGTKEQPAHYKDGWRSY